MPSPPKEDESKSDFIKRCVPVYVSEGYPKDQAVAMCYSMWRKKHPGAKEKARGDGQGQDGDRQGDGGADYCVCPECGYKTEHEKGVPCNEKTCPECGSSLVGENKENSLLSFTINNSFIPIENFIRGIRTMTSSKTGEELNINKKHIHIDLFGNINLLSKTDDRKIIAGYASLAVVDTENEYIPPAVLKDGLETLITDESYANIMLVHKNIQIGKIINKYDGLETHVDDNGLFIVAEIRYDLEIAKEVWKKIEDGEIRGFSIGGEIIEDHEECDDDKCIKVIDKINLFEISVCSNPVNKDSGFKIINKCEVEMLENYMKDMKKKENKPVVKKSEDEECKDCNPEEIKKSDEEEPKVEAEDEDDEEEEEEPETEEKSEPEDIPTEDILTKSDIIETIKETITETLKSLHEKELEEKEPETEEPKEEETVEESDKEVEMALKARDEAIDGFKDEIKKLKEQVKKLEETEEKPKTKKEEEVTYQKDTGIIVDKRHGRVYRS